MQHCRIIQLNLNSFVQMSQELRELGGFEELIAFVHVAEAGSFAAAAKRLERDASVLSRRVSQLEQRLGVRLLVRTTRRIALTEAGALYCRRVQTLLDELADASREASDFATSPQGLLRISVPVTFGRQWIAPLVPRFLVRHPLIRIDAHFSDRFVDIVAEGFDVAFRVSARPVRDSSLTIRTIASYRNLLVAAPSYLAARGTPVVPSDLETHACLGFTGHAAWPDWILAKDGRRESLRPACSVTADHAEPLLVIAIEGGGITFTSDWLAGPALRAGALVEVLPGWCGKDAGGVVALLPPGRLVPAKTRLFVEEVSSAIKAGWTH